MRPFSSEAIAALEAGEARIHGALKLIFDETHRYWSGSGILDWGDGDYLGVQSASLLPTLGGALGGDAAGLELGLSGIDPDIAAATLDENFRQKPAIIFRLIFDLDGANLLDARPWLRTKVDDMPLDETIGGASTISLMLEGAARDMQRRGSRMLSDSDQRVLGGALDGSLRKVGVAGQKINYWGQRKTPPAAPQVSYPTIPRFF